jgi:hypothetical protein
MNPFIEGWSESDIEAVLVNGITDELLYVPIVVGMNSDCVDRLWAENICVKLASHAHIQTRCNALTGLGHIARVCGELSEEKVLPIVSAALHDMSEEVRGYAMDAACDIHHYLGIVVPSYDASHTQVHYEHLVDTVEYLKKRSGYKN